MGEQMELIPYPAGPMNKGISVYTPTVTPDLELDRTTYNYRSGIHAGIGPRFGMAPLPGHVGTETVGASACYAQQRSEGAGTQGLQGRTQVFGIFPVKLGSYSDPKTKETVYAWLTGSSGLYLDVSLSSTFDSGDSTFQHTSDFRAGLPRLSASSIGDTTNYWEHVAALVPQELFPGGNKFQALFQIMAYGTANLRYISAVPVSISGRDVPTPWMFGVAVTDGDADTAPNVNFWRNTLMSSSLSSNIQCGSITDFELLRYKKQKRQVTIECIPGSTLETAIIYTLSYDPTDTIINEQPNYGTGAHLDVSAVAATKIGGTTYTDNDGVLVNDPAAVLNTGYQAILAAPQKAYMVILQDWIRSSRGLVPQFVDIVNNPFYPKDVSTNYTEDGLAKQCCFRVWPAYVTDTAVVTTNRVGLGAAGSGRLRQATVYEITYSLYNKRLDFETNVGTPVKIRTGTDDLVALKLWSASGDDTVAASYIGGTTASPVPFVFGSPDYIPINETEYRFYYRELGEFEWKPALFIDAAYYWFKFHSDTDIVACAAPIAGLPGGQPGGFNDYSRLPNDKWEHVLYWKERAWWFSPTQIAFSLAKNLFAYPTRNNASAPTGVFKGGMIHNQPGESEQTSRLLIFGGTETYVGRFAGDPVLQPIQVSPDVIGEFPLDASNFDIDFWTSYTAFSYRSAIVADGYAYWWGPKGIIRDDGIALPVPVSDHLMPDLNKLYDPSDTDNIHCIYNDQTKEITWFYKPVTADADHETHALVYNIRDEEFLPQKYGPKIDHAFTAKLENSGDLYGQRTFVVARASSAASLQRAYFFDERCRSGDLRPLRDFVVKSYTRPSSGRRELTLASGFDATNLATLAAGDLICIAQLAKYATSMTLAEDNIATVISKDSGAGTIVVQLQDDALMDATATLTQETYFPIWHAAADGVGLNGFTYDMLSRYWAPGGVTFFGIWLYLYMWLRLVRLPSVDAQNITVGHRTPTSGALLEKEVALTDNSDGNCQIYLPLADDETQNRGQAIKLRVRGVHIGSEWVLQYMEAHANRDEGNNLKAYVPE